MSALSGGGRTAYVAMNAVIHYSVPPYLVYTMTVLDMHISPTSLGLK